MDDSCIVVFTSRSVQRMLADGGSQAWKLGATARGCRYLVCTWNPSGDYASRGEALSHGEAFLVAPISAIEPATPPEPAGRYIIRFNEYAIISIPTAWSGQRNPVWYSSLQEIGVDLTTLKFEKVTPLAIQARSQPIAPLTIAAAKQALALNYGVDPSAVEITIRG